VKVQNSFSAFFGLAPCFSNPVKLSSLNSQSETSQLGATAAQQAQCHVTIDLPADQVEKGVLFPSMNKAAAVHLIQRTSKRLLIQR